MEKARQAAESRKSSLDIFQILAVLIKVRVEQLIKATTKAGFPSTVSKPAEEG